MELLERAAEAASCLLRIEQTLAPGGTDLSGLLLTFDVGRILLSLDAATQEVREKQVASREQLSQSFEKMDEEEPWWRVLGNPLTRVRDLKVGAGKGVALQFRTDADNPRLIAILPGEGGLRVQFQGAPEK